MSQDTKIACRNIWKVFGIEPDQFFANGNGAVNDATALRQRIAETGHIGAACNVSFDVGVGEIFAIMGLSGSGKQCDLCTLNRILS